MCIRDSDFTERLLAEEELAVVPGEAFGESGRNHVRISYAYSMEQLEEAMRRIEHFVDKIVSQRKKAI